MYSDNAYQIFFKLNPLPMWIYDVQSNCITDINNSFINEYDYSFDELINKYRSTFLIEELNYLSSNTSLRKSANNKIFKFLKKDGSFIFFDVTESEFIHENKHFKIENFYNISEFLLTENNLRNSNDNYLQLVENNKDVLWKTTPDLVFTYVSGTDEKLRGFKPEEVIGHHLFEFVSPSSVEVIKKQFAERLQQLKDGIKLDSTTYTIEQIKKVGGTIWLEIVSNPIYANNKIIGFQGISRDITERKKTELALIESEERFRLTFETNPDAINLTRLTDGLYVDVNEGFTQILGYTREETIGRTSLEMDIWDNHSDREFLITQLRNLGYCTNLKARFKGKFGIVHGLMSARMIKLQGVPHIITITRDITDITNFENALRESEERYKTVVEKSPAAILVHKDGIIEFVNDSALRILGISSKNEIIGTNALSIVHPDDRTAAIERIKNVIETGIDAELADERIISIDNREILMQVASSRILYNGGFASLVYGIDITEKRKTEQALKQSEFNYQEIFNSTNEAIIVHRAIDGEIIDVNKPMLRMYGFGSKEEVLQYPSEKLILNEAPYTIDVVREYYVKTLTECPQLFEWKSVKKNGDVFWTEISLRQTNNNNQKCILAVVRDISERKIINDVLLEAKEKAEESSRLKTAFLNNMSHEVRTPLNAIVGFAELLKNDNLPREKVLRFVDIINSSSKTLLGIIDDVLEISRLESGRMSINKDQFNLNELIMNIYHSMLPEVHNKSLNLEVVCGSDEDIEIISDKEKIRQVILGLISNALKFTSNGSVKFGYSIHDTEIEFFVVDTGIGIDKEEFDKIFDRFYQVYHGRAKLYSGTGLGLSIARNLVELMNGKIWVNSKLNFGSTFYFSIPCKILDNKIISKSETLLPELNKTSLLIVEDEEQNYEYLNELFIEHVAHIRWARNGVEALALIKNQMPNLILMDIKMPIMDGLEATKKIKELYPNIIIIAQTAYSQPDEQRKALAVGCDAFVSKPINAEKLLSTIQKLID